MISKTYENHNMQGDARLLYKLDEAFGLSGSTKPYYLQGISTANQLITVNLTQWTIDNRSTTTNLEIIVVSASGGTISMTIDSSEALSFTSDIVSITLVTVGIDFKLIGEEIV